MLASVSVVCIGGIVSCNDYCQRLFLVDIADNAELLGFAEQIESIYSEKFGWDDYWIVWLLLVATTVVRHTHICRINWLIESINRSDFCCS